MNRPGPIEIQDRDLALLLGLFESRVMLHAHATRLYFDGRAEAAKKRLQSLKRATLIGERPHRRYEPLVLFLRKQGFVTLSERRDLSQYPRLDWPALEKRLQVSELNLQHELAVVAVKAAVVTALAQLATQELIEFSTWPRLFEFAAERRDPYNGRIRELVKPDGFLRIGERNGEGEFTFFLEVDRSTETQNRLALKALCYRDYYLSGGLAVRYGARRDEFRQFPFRVLMVFQNAARRNNTAERLLQQMPPITQQVWLSTISEVSSDPLGPIWIRPADYHAITTGTRFDPMRGFISRGSEPERDGLVAESIEKLHLLASEIEAAENKARLSAQ